MLCLTIFYHASMRNLIMSDYVLSNVYAIVLSNQLNEIRLKYADIDFATLTSLRKLSSYLPLEDIFQYIYEQTNEPGFNDFLTTNKINGLMHDTDNISWLSEVKNQYEAYIRKRMDLLKLGKEEPKYKRTLCQGYHYSGKHSYLGTHVLFFVPFGAADKGNEPKLFRSLLLDTFYDVMGFETLKQHPIAKYLLNHRNFR